VRKWQKRGDIPAQAKPADVAKVILSLFLGFIVQSAMIGGIDPDTAAKGFEGLTSTQLSPLISNDWSVSIVSSAVRRLSSTTTGSSKIFPSSTRRHLLS
jgi:hypothetical protein